MSVRTSTRVKFPSRRLLNNTSPEPSSSRSAATMPSVKRRKTSHTANTEAEEQDPDRLYCTCKQKDDGKTPMIQCDACTEWYHFKCVGLKKSEAEQLSRYVCDSCAEAGDEGLGSQYVFDVSLLPEPAQLLGAAPNAKMKGGKKKTPRTKGAGSAVKAKIEVVDASSESESSSQDNTSDASGSNFGEDDESEQEAVVAEVTEAEPDRAKGKPAPAKRKSRKTEREVTASYVKGPADHSTGRRAATNDKPKSGANAQSSWGPLRSFVLDKLRASLEAVHHAYYEAQEAKQAPAESQPQAMDVDKPLAVGGAAHDPATSLAAGGATGATSDIAQQPSSSSSLGETFAADVPRPSAEEIKDRALQYATEVEMALFGKHNVLDREKGTLQPDPGYRAQFNLVNSSLQNDLRRDLSEGIVTQRISPAELASMNARDLATEDTLREIQQIEAESLKSLVRIEADAPVKYTKQVLEDAEAVQKIHKAIDRSETGIVTSKAETPVEKTAHVQQSPRKAADDESALDVRSPDQPADDINLVATPTRPELQDERRKSSFSLKAVLGPDAEQNLDRPMSEHDDEDEEPMDIASADNESMGMSLDDEYNMVEEPPKEEQKVEETAEEKLLRLPIIWKGQIENPGDETNKSCSLVGRQVGGPDLGTSPEAWKLLAPRDSIALDGRVRIELSTKYLVDLVASKDLILVAMTPGEGEEAKARFSALLEFHRQRGRHGVSMPYGKRPPPGAPKEIYFVPLAPGESYEFIDLTDRFILPSKRKDDILLAVFIVPKEKPKHVEPPTSAHRAPQPSHLPPQVPVPTPPAAGMPLPTAQALAAIQPPQLGDLQSLLANLNPGILSQFAAPPPLASGPRFNPPPPAPGPAPGPAPFGHQPVFAGAPHSMPNFPPANMPLGPPPAMPPFPPTRQIDTRVSPPAGHAAPARPQPPVHPSRLAAMSRGGGPDINHSHIRHGPASQGHQGRRGR